MRAADKTATGVGHARGGDRGEQGELIDRLITLLDNDALGEHMWYNVGRYAQMFIGGAALNRVDPHTGEEPAPGSVGELMRGDAKP